MFPLHVAREAKRRGLAVVGFGLRGWVDPALARLVDHYEEIDIGQLGHLLSRLTAHQVRAAVMAGKVTKEVFLDPRIQFDAEAMAIISRITNFSVHHVLGAIGGRLAQHGVELLDSSAFLKDSLCPVGVLSRRGPSDQEREDIRIGMRVAQQLAELDVGQTVVVKRSVIAAVEALDGTDAAIRRGGQVAGPGCVVVKMASPHQDRRFDLPIIGLQTLAVLREAQASCVALEAGSALLLDRQPFLSQADQAGVCVIGLDPTGTDPIGQASG